MSSQDGSHESFSLWRDPWDGKLKTSRKPWSCGSGFGTHVEKLYSILWKKSCIVLSHILSYIYIYTYVYTYIWYKSHTWFKRVRDTKGDRWGHPVFKGKKHILLSTKVLVRNSWNVSELTMIAIISLRAILMCRCIRRIASLQIPSPLFVEGNVLFKIWSPLDSIQSEDFFCACFFFSMSLFLVKLLNVVAVMSGDVIPKS